jgi:hypothetical protein
MFKGVRSLPVDYYSNANAWMTCVIFNDWLVKWDLGIKVKNCPVGRQMHGTQTVRY